MEINSEIINGAVDAFNCATTVAHMGMIKVAGGVAVWMAHLNQLDKNHKAPEPPTIQKGGRDAIGRDI